MEDSINTHDYTLGSLIDIEGVFNNVSSLSLIEVLRRNNVGDGIYGLINHILTHRAVTTEIAGSEVTRKVIRCAPLLPVEAVIGHKIKKERSHSDLVC